MQVTDGCFPQPRLQSAPDSDALRDITFTLVEGDFQVCRSESTHDRMITSRRPRAAGSDSVCRSLCCLAICQHSAGSAVHSRLQILGRDWSTLA